MKKGVTIVTFLLLIFFVHIGLQWVEKQSLEWYHTLALPSWIVTQLGLVRIWFAVYIFSAISGALLWMTRKGPRKLALGLWFAVFALSIFWHFAFFYFHSPLLAAIAFTISFFVLAANIYVAGKVNRAAMIFLIPNEFWIVYGSALCWTIFYLN